MYGVATDDNGLYYMRARYYNVSIKRFINQDIINGSITNSQSLNKFSYVQGNPIKLTDPFGLFPCISLSGIGHAALSLLGIIPALDFCDAINAAWYFAEGDYANATISMVAATPFIGSVAGTGIKWGMKATTKAQKIAETVKLGSRIAGGAGGFIISGAQALEAVKNIHANRGADEDGSTWSNVGDYLILGLSIAGMGLSGVSIAKSGKALNGLWKGQDVVEAAAVSNTTKRIVGGSNNKLPTNEEFNNAVCEWTRMQKKLAPSKSKVVDFNTASVAYDVKTGKYYYGMNKGVKLSGDALNSELSNMLPSRSLNGYMLGNCAEVDVVNQALNAGARVEDLYIYTIEAKTNKNRVPLSDFGKPKIACENCTYAFKGKVANIITGYMSEN